MTAASSSSASADVPFEGFRAGQRAQSIPVQFFTEVLPQIEDPDELRAMYERVGVTSGSPVIPYCSTGVRSANTWFTLSALGYSDVRLFSGSFAEWTSDPARPVEVGS